MLCSIHACEHVSKLNIAFLLFRFFYSNIEARFAIIWFGSIACNSSSWRGAIFVLLLLLLLVEIGDSGAGAVAASATAHGSFPLHSLCLCPVHYLRIYRHCMESSAIIRKPNTIGIHISRVCVCLFVCMCTDSSHSATKQKPTAMQSLFVCIFSSPRILARSFRQTFGKEI